MRPVEVLLSVVLEHSFKLKQEEWEEFRKLLESEYGAHARLSTSNEKTSKVKRERLSTVVFPAVSQPIASAALSVGNKAVNIQGEAEMTSGEEKWREIKTVRLSDPCSSSPYVVRPWS